MHGVHEIPVNAVHTHSQLHVCHSQTEEFLPSCDIHDETDNCWYQKSNAVMAFPNR